MDKANDYKFLPEDSFLVHMSNVIWITGLSAAGKTTLAKLLIHQMKIDEFEKLENKINKLFIVGDSYSMTYYGDSNDRVWTKLLSQKLNSN